MKKTHPAQKLLILSTAVNIGGMERVVCSLSRQFAGRGWSVKTIFPCGQDSEALLTWCRGQGVAAQADPALLEAHLAHSRQDALRLRRLVRSHRPDVVNLHYGDNFISLKDVIAVRLAGAHRCIVTVNHPTPWDEHNTQKRKMTRLAAALSHRVVTISDATTSVVRQAGVPTRKIRQIPCGLPVPAHLPTRAEARERLGLPPSAFIVGGLARLVPHKRFADLIDAAARVPDPQGELLVVLAGDGPERAALEGRAAARLKDRAAFLGRVPDVNDFYAACDVFALPSEMEGFGLVYVEAAFHGVPSIGTRVGGVPDAIADGETGLLIPVGDAAALAEAIQRLRDDPAQRRAMGQAALARAHREFTEPIMAQRYEQSFRS